MSNTIFDFLLVPILIFIVADNMFAKIYKWFWLTDSISKEDTFNYSGGLIQIVIRYIRGTQTETDKKMIFLLPWAVGLTVALTIGIYFIVFK